MEYKVNEKSQDEVMDILKGRNINNIIRTVTKGILGIASTSSPLIVGVYLQIPWLIYTFIATFSVYLISTVFLIIQERQANKIIAQEYAAYVEFIKNNPQPDEESFQ